MAGKCPPRSNRVQRTMLWLRSASRWIGMRMSCRNTATWALCGMAASAERHGLDFALQRAAAHGGLACSHWWGTPWWPDIVTKLLARLEDPDHSHWGKDRDWYARLPTQPAEVADRRQLRRLLLDAPEALSDEGAAFCIAAGIGFIHEPIRAWKAAGTAERT